MTETTKVAEQGAGSPSLFTTGIPIGIAIYLLGLSAYLSSKRIMWLDEFFAWGVLTDRSFVHMMHAWLEGADSGGVLYYILGRTLFTMTGPSVLVARLFGAAMLAGAFVLWVRVLRRVFNDRIALLAGCFLLLSAGYVNYLAEVRFYSQLIAAVILAVWLALRVQRETHSPVTVFALFFLVHGALVSSHLLGIVYSAMVLAGLILCYQPKRYIVAVAGTVTSWTLLLFARQPIHVGGLRVAGMQLAPPRWSELLSIYQAQPTALPKVNLAVCLFLLVTLVMWFRRRPHRWPMQDEPSSLLLRISLLLGAAPIIFFFESWAAPWSLWVVRYMLPSIVGLSALVAYAVAYQSNQPWMRTLARPAKRGIFAAALVSVAVLQWIAVRHQILRPHFTEAQLKPIERGLPVVVSDEQLFFQLRFYESGRVPGFYYVHIPLATPAGEHSDLMRTIERQGYWGDGLRTRKELLAKLNDFLMIEDPPRDADLIAALQRQGWTVTFLGTEQWGAREAWILELKGPGR